MTRTLSKLLICIVIILSIIPWAVACGEDSDGGIDIVASVFVPFDLARTVAGERASVTQLLPPGGEGHDWEPPAKVIREIADADLFIYVGGGGDKWAERLLSSADLADSVKAGELRVLCLSDSLDLSAYYGKDSHAHDVDTHFWTSPLLAREMAEIIGEAIVSLDPDGESYYRENLASLTDSITSLDTALREATAGGGKLYFGDKFAFYYLCREYGLEHLSPYAGCSDDALPIDRVVIQMKEEAREEMARIIFCEEYNSASPLANSIADECGATVRELHSCHNLNKADSDAGETYISLMMRNIELIKEALGDAAE